MNAMKLIYVDYREQKGFLQMDMTYAKLTQRQQPIGAAYKLHTLGIPSHPRERD
jgi:hypothetical protein